MRILLINGPNLNRLGQRDPSHYGSKTLEEIISALVKRAAEMGVELATCQSNSEGDLIDFIQENAGAAQGIIINPGALTHYGLSLREALADVSVPIVEVHLSNIYAREQWRHHSVIAPIVRGHIVGLGWRGYLLALESLVVILRQEHTA